MSDDLLDDLPPPLPSAKNPRQAGPPANISPRKRVQNKAAKPVEADTPPKATPQPSQPPQTVYKRRPLSPVRAAPDEPVKMQEAAASIPQIPFSDATSSRPVMPPVAKVSSSTEPAAMNPATPRTVVAPASKTTDADINKHWDAFLCGLNTSTLMALYELGVMSLTGFREWSLQDLQHPRGRLTAPQALEVQAALDRYGVQLSNKDRLPSDGREPMTDRSIYREPGGNAARSGDRRSRGNLVL